MKTIILPGYSVSNKEWAEEAAKYLNDVRTKLAESGNTIESFELTQKPKNTVTVSEVEKAKKVLNFIDILNDHDDVQKVFTNLDIPSEIVNKL